VTPPNASSAASAPKRKRVLVVEDDDDARDVLGELIASLGHEVVPAASALEALELARGAGLDVALIDLGLAGTDGCEVARQIRNTVAGGSMRLVALTGYSDRQTRKSAAEAGFDDFIVKPAHCDVIAELLSQRTSSA
jgi:CheY-like chemotaxis protein